MSEFEMQQFYDDMHSHYYEHRTRAIAGCEMCKLVLDFRLNKNTPAEWNPPRENGRPIKTDEYIKGLSNDQE